MIKVGLFIDTYFPMIDGVINVVHNYAQRINDGEFEVTVFCPVADKKYKDEFGYRVVRCKSAKISFLDYRLPMPKTDGKFKKTLKNSNLDIVHIHSPFSVGKMGVRYAKKYGIPVIATMHSQFKQDFYRATHSNALTGIMLKTVMKVFNNCDECYAVNGRVAEIFLEYGAKRMPKVMYNATEMLPATNIGQACRLAEQTYGIAPDTPLLLFVGRLTALKNIYFIVDSLALLKDVDFKMFFVGSGQDEVELQKRIDKQGLGDKVKIIGRVSDREMLKSLYSRAKLFLFPSLYDANSLVQIEAASQKTPTLFAEGAATSSMVTDGVNGYIAPADPQKYADKIAQILSDEQAYLRVCDGAFNDLYCSWDDAVEKLKNMYKNTIEQYNIDCGDRSGKTKR